MSDERRITDNERVKSDMEFIQNLCNASYLQFLAQNKYFEDKQFLNYLNHLRYWNEPQFKRFLIFPQCLEILDNLLENELFRKELVFPQFVAFFHQQQGSSWMMNKQTTKLVEAEEFESLALSLQNHTNK